MSIRIRRIEGRLIALCAARSMETVGDIYLDDEAHHALAEKFAEDFTSEGDHRRFDLADAALRAAAESNNPNRTWWDSIFASSQETP